MVLIRTVSTTAFKRMKEKFYGFRQTEAMFTLYRIDYRSAPKTISDRPSVHIWPRRSGTVPVTITSWNAPIPKVIRSVSYSFLERSARSVNGQNLADRPHFWKGISLSLSWTRGKVSFAKRKQIWSISIRYSVNSSTPNRYDLVRFPWEHCSHCIGSISEPDGKSIRYSVNIAWAGQACIKKYIWASLTSSKWDYCEWRIFPDAEKIACITPAFKKEGRLN